MSDGGGRSQWRCDFTPDKIQILLRYSILFSVAAEKHLAALRKYEQQRAVQGISQQLGFDPALPTRNRKRLRPNVLADWELRIGDLRVYYVISEEAKAVSVVAIGRKERDRVFVAGEELIL